MSGPASEPRRLNPQQARRMLGALSLRPNERVLCLGPDGGAVPGVAAILVGPTGKIVEAEHAAAATGGTLPYPDGEFDAVVIDLTTPHPDQTHVLAEVARVTAPTGRVALAVPQPTDASPATVQQLAEQAGLRGVAVRTDPDTDPDHAPVQFVTAFPPAPAKPGDDADNTTEIDLPKPSGRPRLLAGAAAALVLAAAAGVAWSLAAAEPGQDMPDGRSDVLVSDTEFDLDRPDTREQPAEDAPASAGQPTDNQDSGSGSVSESGAGSGGGQPSNRPPVIDSPGLSSVGLVLTIAPEVSDPDGDDVTLLFDVGGMTVDPAQTCSTPGCKGDETPNLFPTVAGVRLDFADVGYAADIPVTIIATDAHGATSRETYSHTVSAHTRVTFRDFRYAINDPSACFDATESRVLSFSLSLEGAFPTITSKNHTISASNPSGMLDIDRAGGWDGRQPPPLTVSLSVSLSDIGTSAFPVPRSYQSDAEASMNIGLGSPCRGVVSYRITFETS